MIEIDLLPVEFRKKKKISFERVFNTKLILVVLGSLILFHLFIHLAAVVSTKRLGRLARSRENLSSQAEQVDQLKAELAKINKDIPLIEQLTANRVLWSEKLSRINNLITGGIWLKELVLEKQKAETKDKPAAFLIIRGSAASRTKDEPALIGRFMQNLKEDASFSADFAEIELGPIKKRQIAQTEVMDFILLCRFKPDRAQMLLR